MTLQDAIKRARRRVSIVNQGSQYVLHTWSPRHNAVFVSHCMDYSRVRACAREALMREALEALSVDDADAKAFVLSEHEGTWTDLVRGFMRKKANVPQ